MWKSNSYILLSQWSFQCFKFTTKVNIVKFVSWVIKCWIDSFFVISLHRILLTVGSLNESDSPGIHYFLAWLVQDTSALLQLSLLENNLQSQTEVSLYDCSNFYSGCFSCKCHCNISFDPFHSSIASCFNWESIL